MSELVIYEGCYVELRNGDIRGPMSKSLIGSKPVWIVRGGSDWWFEDGRIRPSAKMDGTIVRVLSVIESRGLWKSEDRLELLTAAAQGTIPPHVLTAAMDAGIKAKPVYEQFVNAILEAGFQAQYGIEFVGRSEQPEVTPVPRHVIYNALDAAITGPMNGDSRREGTPGERLAYLTDAVVAAISKTNLKIGFRIPKSRRGLSDPTSPPLEGMSICFTGNFDMPRDTHKGIAESLGARVSGSVHSHTSLVVFGPGAGASSKLTKAIDLNLPRMSESGWLWLAARLGYGKPQHVSPYGRITSPRVEIKPKSELFTISYCSVDGKDFGGHNLISEIDWEK